MKAEILFPEICNLCGDGMNVRYLQQSCPALEVISCDLKSRPAFLDGGVDLVYLGSTTEKGLGLILQALTPVREEILARIEAGQLFLATGNALDVFGERIQSDQGLSLEGLHFFKTHAEYHMMQRHNSFYLGTFTDDTEHMDIVGFKSLFGHTYGSETEPLFQTVRGVGRHEGEAAEGFRRNNFFVTYLTGPLLVLNPPFAKYLLRKMGASDALAFEDAAMDAYRQRLEEFRDVHREWEY